MQYDGWCRSRSRNTFSEGWNGSATFPLSIHYFVLLLRARTNEATAAPPADQPQQQQDSQRTVFRRRRKGTQNREARGTLALQYSRRRHTHIITQVPCQRITAVVYTSERAGGRDRKREKESLKDLKNGWKNTIILKQIQEFNLNIQEPSRTRILLSVVGFVGFPLQFDRRKWD